MRLTNIPTYEFLMWENCNNHCRFCFQDRKRNNLTLDQKKESIAKVISFLKSDLYLKQSHVMLVGGEIFDIASLLPDFIPLIDIIIDMMKTNDINLLYINTNLMYKNLSIVDYLCDKIDANCLSDRLRLTVSYDIEGRFANDKLKKLVLDNIKYVRSKYKCNIIINTILTKPLCELIINGSYNPAGLLENCDYINYLPYIVLDDALTPDRNLLFNTLIEINKQIHDYLKPYAFKLDFNTDKRLYAYRSGEYVYCSSKNSECSHSVNFKKYSKHNTCYVCDIKKLSDMI